LTLFRLFKEVNKVLATVFLTSVKLKPTANWPLRIQRAAA
jgi:hypothetical protein